MFFVTSTHTKFANGDTMDEKNVVATTEENAETKEILDELAAEPAVKKNTRMGG